MGFTVPQQRALSIAPRISGPLSMVGSGLIMNFVISELRRKAGGPYHRLLFGMSLLDFIASFSFSFSTTPIPSGTPGVWAPSGNISTCNAQGFLTHLGFGVPVYNVSLAVYALLVARCGWKQEEVQRIEPFMHIVALVYAFGTAAAGFPLKLYNNANVWCWIAPFPSGCKSSMEYGAGGNCLRGDNSTFYRMVFAYGPVWFCISLCAIIMALVYRTVLLQEKDVDKFQAEGVEIRTQSKRVASQAFWFLVSLCVTWIPCTLVRLLQGIPATKGTTFFSLTISFAVVLPMQGFFNFLVFFRARFVKYRRIRPDSAFKEATLEAIFGTGEEVSQTTSQDDFDSAGDVWNKEKRNLTTSDVEK